MSGKQREMDEKNIDGVVCGGGGECMFCLYAAYRIHTNIIILVLNESIDTLDNKLILNNSKILVVRSYLLLRYR